MGYYVTLPCAQDQARPKHGLIHWTIKLQVKTAHCPKGLHLISITSTIPGPSVCSFSTKRVFHIPLRCVERYDYVTASISECLVLAAA